MAGKSKTGTTGRKPPGRPKGSKSKPRTGPVEQTAPKGAGKTVEASDRYRGMYADWVRGFGWSDLAEKYKCSEARAYEVINDLRTSDIDVLGLDRPMMALQTAQDLILTRKAAISQAAVRLSKMLDGDNDAMAVAWHRRRADELNELVDLLTRLGYLPRNLGGLRDMVDVVAASEALIDALEDEVPQELIERFVGIFNMRTSTGPDGRLQLDMSAGAWSKQQEGEDGEIVNAEVVA